MVRLTHPNQWRQILLMGSMMVFLAMVAHDVAGWVRWFLAVVGLACIASSFWQLSLHRRG